MLISVSVLMTLAARDFTSSLNRASGHAAGIRKDSGVSIRPSIHPSAGSVNSCDSHCTPFHSDSKKAPNNTFILSSGFHLSEELNL